MLRVLFGSAILWLFCGLTIPASAQALPPDLSEFVVDGWRECAPEGQTCNVNGRATVRFGADDRWYSRTVSYAVRCTNDSFGDPAPGVAKRCQVRVSDHSGAGTSGGAYRPGSAQGWRYCAGEGEVCRFNGRAEVRFGQGNNFVTRTAYGSVRCDVADFGDPARGTTKFCEVRPLDGQSYQSSNQSYWGGGDYGAQNSGWRYCAAEGGNCRVKGNGRVRFGDGRNFKYMDVTGEIPCTTSTFGDPARGTTKHCEVQNARYDDGGYSGGWTQCAREGERCNFSGFAQLRFGAAGRYAYRDGAGGVICSVDEFGQDPYPGRVKSCEIRR